MRDVCPAVSPLKPGRLAIVALLAVAAALMMGALAPSGADAATKWLCKPGAKPNPCKGSLATTVISSDGSSTVETPKNAKKPKYDCFYVYPTVSEQPTPNANKEIDPQQTAIAQYQAARYSEHCKVYAPVYRQATLAGISDPDNTDPAIFEKAYGDVLKAWKNYLKKYNKGRGFILIGHSQGTGMLSQLLASEIEKKKSQHKRLISALLLGGNVTVEKNGVDGGSFQKTPLCEAKKQTRCVIAFSTFNETPPPDALFGRTDGPFAAVPPGANPASSASASRSCTAARRPPRTPRGSRRRTTTRPSASRRAAPARSSSPRSTARRSSTRHPRRTGDFISSMPTSRWASSWTSRARRARSI
jgi:hypothetical protein